MYIESVGSGPDLVLIHGWAMNGGIFAPLVAHLRDRFRCHLVDLPGHGFSRDDHDALDAHRCAERISEQVSRAIWLGWSLGGLVSLDAALRMPAQVRGIVQIASSPCFLRDAEWSGIDRAAFQQMEMELRADFRAVVERFLALEVLGSRDAQSELRALRTRAFERGEPSPAALEQGMRVLETTDRRADLHLLRMPNLWVAGRRDRIVSAGAMAWSAQQNPFGSFVEMPSGHAPFLSFAPEMADAVIDFAERIGA